MADNYIWITMAEAAARLGTNVRRIQYLLDKGELTDNGQKNFQRRVKWVSQGGDGSQIKSTAPDMNQLKLLKTAEEIKILRQKNEKENQQKLILWNDAFRRVLVKGGFMFLNECKKEKIEPAMALRVAGYLTTVFNRLPDMLAEEFENNGD